MEKPKEHTRSAYDIMEVFCYVEEKYNTEKQGCFLDFWHWVVDHFEPDNGVDIHMNTTDILKLEKKPFIRTIVEHLQTEFGEEITCHVSW